MVHIHHNGNGDSKQTMLTFLAFLFLTVFSSVFSNIVVGFIFINGYAHVRFKYV